MGRGFCGSERVNKTGGKKKYGICCCTEFSVGTHPLPNNKKSSHSLCLLSDRRHCSRDRSPWDFPWYHPYTQWDIVWYYNRRVLSWRKLHSSPNENPNSRGMSPPPYIPCDFLRVVVVRPIRAHTSLRIGLAVGLPTGARQSHGKPHRKPYEKPHGEPHGNSRGFPSMVHFIRLHAGRSTGSPKGRSIGSSVGSHRGNPRAFPRYVPYGFIWDFPCQAQ